MAAFLARSFTTCHTTRSVTPSPQVLPARQTHRNTGPSLNSAGAPTSRWRFSLSSVQAPSGYGGLCRSNQRWPNDPRCVADGRRSPQPKRMAGSAWSRLPFSVFGSGTCQRALAWSVVSQLPSRTPGFFGPVTRRMPAARSGLSKPEAAASYARRVTAASLPSIVPGAS